MAQTGRPPAEGERYPCGKLRPVEPDFALARRAELVGDEHKADPMAEWELGRLALRGCLVDPGVDPDSDEGREQTRLRYDAGLHYAEDHAILYGNGSAPSHLKNLVQRGRSPIDPRSDTRLEAATARLNRKYSDAMMTPPAGRELGHYVLAKAVLHDIPVTDERDLETLRRVLDRVGGAKRKEHFHQDRPEMQGIEVGRSNITIIRSAGDCADPSILPKKLRRRGRGLDILFSPPGNRSDDEKAAIAAALDKLRPPAKQAEAEEC